MRSSPTRGIPNTVNVSVVELFLVRFGWRGGASGFIDYFSWMILVGGIYGVGLCVV